MDLTIDQKLEQGFRAHKDGKYFDAERLYRSVLDSIPLHPDANHNLGILAVKFNKPYAALPLFENAVKANKNIEQFWLSYIELLIKLNRLYTAKKEIEQFIEIFHKSHKIGYVKALLESKNFNQTIFNSLEQFYKKNTNRILSEAAEGWFFVDSFDRLFMEGENNNSFDYKDSRPYENNRTTLRNKKKLLKLTPTEIIENLNNEVNISKKYNYIKELINSSDTSLVKDSFYEYSNINLNNAIDKTFDSVNLNLVIIGGGVCGLFLANTIKCCLGDRANILVLENRSSSLNTRETFKRDWLTHIPNTLFQFGKPSNILSLIECFGINGLIGIPINILEAILQLSCKDQGVKFFFSSNLDFSSLSNDKVNLVFDATGGSLSKRSYPVFQSNKLNVKIPKKNINLKYAGVNQLHNVSYLEKDYIDRFSKLMKD